MVYILFYTELCFLKIDIMKCYVFFAFLLLCAFTKADIPNDRLGEIAQYIGLSRNNFEICLNKGNTNLETFLVLSDEALGEETIEYPQEMIKKVGTVTACIFKIHGVLRDSKCRTDEFFRLINRVKPIKTSIPQPIVNAIQKCCEQDISDVEESKIVFNFITCFKMELRKLNM